MNEGMVGILQRILTRFNFSSISDGQVLIGKNRDVQLLDLSGDDLKSPVGEITTLLTSGRKLLPDNVVDSKNLDRLVNRLLQNKSIIRLNHIGFCYQVVSLEDEKTRLIKSLKNLDYHFYEELSSSEDVWLFLGNVDKWDDPTLEFVLIKNTSDPDKDYWLPHIQIDVDTTLSPNQINDLIQEVYSGKIKPFPIVIDGTTYIMRCRLGRIRALVLLLRPKIGRAHV